MLELAITRGSEFISYTRNAKTITMPGGTTVYGPLSSLPLVHGDFTIREVVIEGPAPAVDETGGTSGPVVDGDVVRITRTVQAMPEQMAAAVFVRTQSEALAQIDADAETARLAFITAGDGMAMVYERKKKQARDCLANYGTGNLPPDGTYPALEAEVGITGDTVLAVAAAVAASAENCESGFDAIETVRLKAKSDIAATTALTEIPPILAAIEWPQPSESEE